MMRQKFCIMIICLFCLTCIAQTEIDKTIKCILSQFPNYRLADKDSTIDRMPRKIRKIRLQNEIIGDRCYPQQIHLYFDVKENSVPEEMNKINDSTFASIESLSEENVTITVVIKKSRFIIWSVETYKIPMKIELIKWADNKIALVRDGFLKLNCN